MAFNPFRRMRKHQKAIMAGVILLSMFTFVGVSGAGLGGGGDLFSSVMGLFTKRGVRDTDVASLYGKQISEQELMLLQKQRLIANNFMIMATGAAAQNRRTQISKTLGTNPQAMQALEMRVRQDPTYMELQQRYMMGAMFGQPYFGGGLDTQGLLDFLIWKHEADRLGIKLTQQDVNKEINRLTQGLFTKDDSGKIERDLRNSTELKNFWSDGILQAALTDEFRVRLARNAMTGFEAGGGIDRVAAPVTPAEFWDFYKDNRTAVEVGLFPVKVEDFLSQVKEKPTEDELKALYNLYKDRDYSPESAEPGFKRPHRIQLEWVSANADSPYYKKLAAESLPLVETLQQTLAAGTSPYPLAGPSVAGINVALASTLNGKLLDKYNERKWRYYRNPALADYWLDPYPLHASSYKHPTDVAAVVGQMFGLAATPAAPLSAVSTAETLAVRREVSRRALYDITLSLLGGPVPLPISGGALVAYGTPKEEFIPLKKVKDELLDKVSAESARDVRNYVIETVKKEIDKLPKKDKPAAVAKYIAEAVKNYHLQTGKSTGLRGEFLDPIGDDPGMAAFKEAYLKPPSEDPTGKRFGEQFFPPPPRFGTEKPWDVFQAKQWPDRFLAASADNVFLYWKTQDQPSKIMPLSDPEVRKAVEAAWRFQKARALAKKEADKLAQQVGKEKGDRRKLKDLAEQLKKSMIELMPMARKNRQPTPSPDAAYQYGEPKIPEDRVPHIGRAAGFADKVVGLRNKQKGDTLVLPDQPEGTYYVVVLIDKLEPSYSEFYRVYQDSSTNARRKDPLLTEFEQQQQGKYLQDFMERLRKDAKLEIHQKKAKSVLDEGGGPE